MCVLGQPEPVGSVLMFPSGYDTLEYSWVKATTVSVRLRILFVTLQNTNMQAIFFQKDHVAWSCPTVDHAPIPFFLADHVQECAHINKIHQHDVAFY